VRADPTVRAALVILATTAVVGLLYAGRSLWIPLSIGGLIAMLVSPIHHFFIRKGWPSWLGITVSMLLVLAVFGGLVGAIGGQAASFADKWPKIEQRVTKQLQKLEQEYPKLVPDSLLGASASGGGSGDAGGSQQGSSRGGSSDDRTSRDRSSGQRASSSGGEGGDRQGSSSNGSGNQGGSSGRSSTDGGSKSSGSSSQTGGSGDGGSSAQRTGSSGGSSSSGSSSSDGGPLQQAATGMGGGLWSSISRALSLTASALGALLLIFVFTILFMTQEKRLRTFVLRSAVSDGSEDEGRRALSEISDVAQSYLRGRIFLIGVLFVLYAIGFTISNVQYALFAAFLASVLSIVPYVGNIIGGALAIAVALVSGGTQPVIGVLVTMSVAQLLENYVLTPLIVGDEVSLNPLATIVAVVAFGLLWGPIGAIVAIPIVAMLRVVCDHIESLRPLGLLLGDRPPEEAASS